MKKKVAKKKTSSLKKASPPKKILKKKSSASKKRISPKKLIKKKAPPKKKPSVSKKRISPKKAVKKKPSVSKKRISPKKAAKKKASPKKKAKKKPSVSKKRITPKKAAKKKASPKSTAKKKIAKQKSTSRRATTSRLRQSKKYMNPNQLKYFHDILLSRKNELINEADRTVGCMQSDSNTYADTIDQASQEEEFTLQLKERDRERRLLQKINEALIKIDNHEYGFCISCGAEIGINRLEARPTTDQCIDCKELDEIKERHL